MIIKTHKQLAEQIAGKSILHLNSFGKESVLTLKWLTEYAHPARVVSLNYYYFAQHPGDAPYFEYLKKTFPSVEFVREPNAHNVTRMCLGHYQSPIDVINFYNNLEYDTFDFGQMTQDICKEKACDYICDGRSRSDSFRRATIFHQKGILIGNKISPLGMMSKKQIFDLLKSSGLKLHQVYKLSAGTLDAPSYFKYRSTFIAKPEFEKQMLEIYPLLALDKYRWQELFGKG